MKFRVRKRKNNNVVEFGADYFSDSTLNSLENINHKEYEPEKIRFQLSLADLKSEMYSNLFITESIDDIVSKLQEFTKPIKNNSGTIIPRKIMIGVEYSNKKKASCECYLKSLTYKKINKSLVDLELEFIGNRCKL